MKINGFATIDPALPPFDPIPRPESGVHIGTHVTESAFERQWARASSHPAITVDGWIRQTTYAKARTVAQQLLEIVGNRGVSPSYVQHEDTVVNAELDGWYTLVHVVPDYKNAFSGQIPFKLTYKPYAPLTARRAVGWRDASIAPAAALTQPPQHVIGLPTNGFLASGPLLARVGAEGLSYMAVNSPTAAGTSTLSVAAPFFAQRCHAYDSVTVPTTGLPTGPEVYGVDHNFGAGGLIVTDGLVLLQVVAQGTIAVFFWDQFNGSTQWTQAGDFYLTMANTPFTALVVQNFDLIRLSTEEVVARVTWMATSNTSASAITELRLSRSHRRADIEHEWTSESVQTQGIYRYSPGGAGQLILQAGALTASPGAAMDVALAGPNDVQAAALTLTNVKTAIIPGARFLPMAFRSDATGDFYADKVQMNLGQPAVAGGRVRYALGMLPTADASLFRLEAQGQTGIGGAASVVDVKASASHAVKLSSQNDGVSFTVPLGTIPLGGTYRLAVRARQAVASGAQMTVGGTSLATQAYGPPNGADYRWFGYLQTAVLTQVGGGQFIQILKSDAGASAVYLDEVAIIPMLSGADFPVDHWAQWIGDKIVRYPVFP